MESYAAITLNISGWWLQESTPSNDSIQALAEVEIEIADSDADETDDDEPTAAIEPTVAIQALSKCVSGRLIITSAPDETKGRTKYASANGDLLIALIQDTALYTCLSERMLSKRRMPNGLELEISCEDTDGLGHWSINTVTLVTGMTFDDGDS